MMGRFDGFEAFAAVIKAGGFSAAADVTGHSTSYISKEVNKLEARLGVRLMNRTTRSIGLTPDGEVFYERVQQLIDDADNAIALLGHGEANPKGVLKISCPVGMSLHLLRPHFSAFLEAYPDISLDMDVSDRRADIIADGFDVVIRAQSELEDSSLISRHLFATQGYLVATPEYLERYGTPTKPQDLLEHKCISFSQMKNPLQWQFQTPEGDSETVEVAPHILCNSAEMELALVKEHQGLTRMPGFNVQHELDAGTLVSLMDDYALLNIDVFMVYSSRKHVSPKVRAFIDFMLARFKG